MGREKNLILQGSPCHMDYFDKTLLTIMQARERGVGYCSNMDDCKKGEIPCALNLGLQVAGKVIQGSNLKQELEELAMAPWLDMEFWNSVNGKEYVRLKGKAKVLRAIESYARVVLLQDPFDSVFPTCEKCNGSKIEKTVMDSIHDGPFPLSGSGKTRGRTVLYCPSCDPEPQGTFLDRDPADDDLEIIKHLGD